MGTHRWLFVAVAQFGRLLPSLALAEELRKRGDDVFVYAPTRVRKTVEAAGCTLVEGPEGGYLDIHAAMAEARTRELVSPPGFFPPRAKLFFEKRERELRFRRTVRAVIERTAREVGALARRLDVNAVVGESLSFGARLGAEVGGKPFASLAGDPFFALDGRGVPHLLPDPRLARVPMRVWYPLVDAGLPLGDVRRRLGLPKATGPLPEFYAQVISSDLHVVVAPRWFIGGSAGAAHLYTAPMSFAPPPPPEVASPRADRGTVAVAGSTTEHPRGRAMLIKTVRALAKTDLDVVVTAGKTSGALGELPPNVRVIESYVDHGELFPRVGLLVNHGGWGTVGRALRCGTPTLVIPAFGPQFHVAERLAATGVGRSLPLESSPDAIVAAVRGALADEDLRRRAADVAAEMARQAPEREAADALVGRFGGGAHAAAG